jgi:hypothetical protein
MRAVTGIELGPDTCVLASVTPGRDGLRISTAHGLQSDAGLPDTGRGAHLERVRRDGGFARHARVVAWGLPDGTPRDDVVARAALAPLVEAGFAIDSVMSPPEALAQLARQRPRPLGRAAAAWLSLNCHAAAIAIVFDGQLLFSRVFDWNYRAPGSVREELLQRYSLVAHLAPELRHGFDVVRKQHGVSVDAVVTCGDLPDLRSLTMPLIEELDMEVETLDSIDDVEIADRAASKGVRERAPAIRLACAAAAAGGLVPRRGVSPVLVAAAAVAIVALLSAAYVGISRLSDPNGATTGAAPQSAPAATASSAASPPPPTPTRVETPPTATPPAAAPPRVDAAPPRVDPPVAERPLEKPAGDPARPAATMGRRERPQDATAERREPAPLNEPLPAVNSILVSPERRLAVLNGVIVREGDAVGSRVLIRIEPGAVLLREPSGREIRVPIRRRVGMVSPQ